MFLFVWNIQNSQIRRDKVDLVVAKDWRRESKCKVIA